MAPSLPETQPAQSSLKQIERSDRQRESQRLFFLVHPHLRRGGQRVREIVRRLRGARPVIDFFHQVDDPYSLLALEAIGPLLDAYEVDFRFHLVSATDGEYAPEPELLAAYAQRDCAAVAPHYGLPFPHTDACPSREDIERIESWLAGAMAETPRPFREVAIAGGRALWAGDSEALEELASHTPEATPAQRRAGIAAGNALRARRGHYSGAMFWYAGEWYWGVDRLHHLERRLIRLGVARDGRTRPRFVRPPLDAGHNPNRGRLALEVFPSLRSPYTAVIFERSLALAASVGVPVQIRPVMPMVMRGQPVPARKGLYIMADAMREAEAIGAPFGNMYDPIGRAVERGFSLWPFARDRGRGAEFLAAFLRAAFCEGRELASDAGLRHVVERAGLRFEQARAALDSQTWRAELEANRQTLFDELGLWGVPSYRLRSLDGESGVRSEEDLCVWGQDRLWLVAAEMRRRLAEA